MPHPKVLVIFYSLQLLYTLAMAGFCSTLKEAPGLTGSKSEAQNLRVRVYLQKVSLSESHTMTWLLLIEKKQKTLQILRFFN